MAPRYALPDSESEDEQPGKSTPSTAKLEKALREAVGDVFKSGNMEELTVKRVRLAAEKKLGLDQGWFKGDAEWKEESDRIIKDEVEIQDRVAEGKHGKDEYKEASPPPSKPTKPAKPAKATKRENDDDEPTSRKRRKSATPESEESAQLSEETEEEVKPAKKQSKAKPKAKPKAKAPSKDRVSDESEIEEEVKKPEKKPKAKSNEPQPKSKDRVSDDSDAENEGAKPSEEANADKEGSESELSVLIDEEPPKPDRKRQKSAEAAPAKAKKAGKAKEGKAKEADTDPDKEEIKRLQGWLTKCGIRKFWARELAPYETPKAKIKHLKEMLKDAGMEGRYSLEKAKRIRDERELKADLEMVQEGAKIWGRDSEEEGSEGERPRRRLARGRQSLAFLENEGEEESD